MKLVSVIIPCFNAAPFVADAIESLLKQTYPAIEIIVVNDGSTDGSAEILENLKASSVRIIHQSNAGQCAAANRGYREARGELIKFFDADDLMHPDMIKLQVERLNGRQDAISFGEWTRFYGPRPNHEKFHQLTMYVSDEPSRWLTREWANARPMMHCALFLIPRPIIEARGLWNEQLTLINDFEFFSRILLGAQELLYTPNARFYYRSGLRGSLSSRKTRAAIESQFLSLSLGTGHLLVVDDGLQARRACANLFLEFIYGNFPAHRDLRVRASRRIQELGGGDLEPDGPPGFRMLKPWIGWKAARRVQTLANAFGLSFGMISNAFRVKNSEP